MKLQDHTGTSLLNFVMLLAVLSLLPNLLHAGPFEEDNTTAVITLGSGQFADEDYLIFGAGMGYYIIDGVEVGLNIDYWSGGDPSIYEITPKLTYVYDNTSQLNPYLGMFYNRTFIEDLDDSNSLGYRAGVYMPAGRKSYFGIGVVHTELQDCEETVFNDCSETYSEISFIFTL